MHLPFASRTVCDAVGTATRLKIAVTRSAVRLLSAAAVRVSESPKVTNADLERGRYSAELPVIPVSSPSSFALRSFSSLRRSCQRCNWMLSWLM